MPELTMASALVGISLVAIVFYALRRKRDVRMNLKLLGVSFSFEAIDGERTETASVKARRIAP